MIIAVMQSTQTVLISIWCPLSLCVHLAHVYYTIDTMPFILMFTAIDLQM